MNCSSSLGHQTHTSSFAESRPIQRLHVRPSPQRPEFPLP